MIRRITEDIIQNNYKNITITIKLTKYLRHMTLIILNFFLDFSVLFYFCTPIINYSC